jgi:hypothetical protein
LDIWGLLWERHRQALEKVEADGPGLLGHNLQAGIRDAHAKDVKVLKKHIVDIYALENMPADKTQWGAYNEQTASLLQPQGVDKGSTDWCVFY